MATGIAVTVAALEVAGCLLTVKALYDYSQDGDEEALFKEVALGFLFLGAGKVVGHYADDIVKFFAKGGDEALEAASKGLMRHLTRAKQQINKRAIMAK